MKDHHCIHNLQVVENLFDGRIHVSSRQMESYFFARGKMDLRAEAAAAAAEGGDCSNAPTCKQQPGHARTRTHARTKTYCTYIIMLTIIWFKDYVKG